jgi:hypothetical protein
MRRYCLRNLPRRRHARDAMPMSCYPAEINRAFQKLIPHPQKVFDALQFQGNARPNTRVAKKILPSDD